MQVIGFNFTKISAERSPELKPSSFINTNIEFTDAVKEEVDFLKEGEAIKLSFKFEIAYQAGEGKKEAKHASVLFEGYLIITASNEDIKTILKNYKKKELPANFRVPLFNLILKKCSIKALDLQDQLNLPSNVKIPQVALQSLQEEKK